MTGRTLAPLLRGEAQAGPRSRVHRTGAPRQRAARGFELSGESGPDERLSLYPELPRRIAGRRATRSCTSRLARSATSTADRRSRSSSIARADPSIARYFQLATAKRRPRSSTTCVRDPHQLTQPRRSGRASRSAAAPARGARSLDARHGDPRATPTTIGGIRFPYYGQPAK